MGRAILAPVVLIGTIGLSRLDKLTFQFGGTDDNSEIGVYISIFVVVYNQAMF